MQRIRDSITINSLPRLIPWGVIAIRILLACALFESLHSHGSKWAYPATLMLLCWAAASLAFRLLGHMMQRRNLLLQFWTDIVVGVATVFVAPETMIPAAALIFGSSQLLIRAGYSLFYVATVAAVFAAGLTSTGIYPHSVVELLGPKFERPLGYALLYCTLIVTLLIAAISAARGDQLRQFSDQALSIRMLKLDRSMEFDLQRLIELVASLFPPARATCLISAASQNAATRSFVTGRVLDLDPSEMERLMAYHGWNSCDGILFDNNGQLQIDLSTQDRKAFEEDDRKIGYYLARNGVTVAFCKPFRIGRSHGLLINALTSSDALTIFEVGFVCDTLDKVFPFLDSVAEAERGFIADAHDVARRDLHDGVLQTLAAVRMRLLTLAKQKSLKDNPARAEIQKVADILTLEQARLRGLLETSEDEDHGINLVTRLDVELRTISMQWDIDARLEAEDPAIPIDKESVINIEHLVREAVANAVRHAKSTQLTVRLSLHHNELRIVIVDRNDTAPLGVMKKGKQSMPLRSASLLHRLRLVNGSAYADGLESRGILAISIPMQRTDNA